MKRFAATVPVLLVLLLVFASAAATRPAPKVARIGMLCAPLCNVSYNNASFDELRKLGWVEGTTIVIERKDPDYRLDLLPGLAADLVRSKPNLSSRRTVKVTRMPSRPGEFHPEPLTDPDLILSHHPARAID